MRILLDPGEHSMRNAGGIALLQVAKERLNKMWPDASFEIVTQAPHVLKYYFPDAYPVDPFSHSKLIQSQDRIKQFQRLLPRMVWRIAFELREEVRHRQKARTQGAPGSEKILGLQPQSGHTNLGDKPNNEIDFPLPHTEILHGVDLYVTTGAQYITDIVRDLAFSVLDRLEAAIQLGIPTAMVGQGIGPLEDRELRARVGAVLPSVNLIFIREQRDAPHILDSLDVDPSKIFFTGDDALEPAYEARASLRGTGIGVGLRVSYYTDINSSDITVIGKALKEVAASQNAQLITLPISQSAYERDNYYIQKLIAGYDQTRNLRSRFHTPEKIIKNTRDCRMVLSGTYHTAVFALAQGIPAVCVAKSRAYLDKLLGLSEQFSPGCQVVNIGDQHFEEKLKSVLEETWVTAEQIRPLLLESTQRQIRLGQAAYQQIYDLVESRTMSCASVKGSYDNDQ